MTEDGNVYSLTTSLITPQTDRNVLIFIIKLIVLMYGHNIRES